MLLVIDDNLLAYNKHQKLSVIGVAQLLPAVMGSLIEGLHLRPVSKLNLVDFARLKGMYRLVQRLWGLNDVLSLLYLSAVDIIACVLDVNIVK